MSNQISLKPDPDPDAYPRKNRNPDIGRLEKPGPIKKMTFDIESLEKPDP